LGIYNFPLDGLDAVMPDAPTTDGSATATATRTAARAPEVDRFLCASTWLVPEFGCYLFRELFRPGLRAAAPAYGVDLVALAQHTRAARRYRARMIWLVVAIAVLTLAAVVIALPNLFAALLILLAGIVLLVVLAGVHIYFTRARASRIFTMPSAPAAGLPPLPPAVDERLRALVDPNGVVFDGGVPFVGAGELLERWKVRVDTGKAATDNDGAKKTITPVRAEELQKKLTLAVRRAGIPDIQVHNRMFVAGHHTHRVAGLLPDPQGHRGRHRDRAHLPLRGEGLLAR
jgi:hypothetical protein